MWKNILMAMKVIWLVVKCFLVAKTESFSECRRIGLNKEHVSKSLAFILLRIWCLRIKKRNENSQRCLNISFKLNIGSFLCQKLLE